MSDLISRQVAIDALVKAIKEDPYYDSNEPINGLGLCDVRVILNDVPSAQPNSEKSDRFCKTCHYVDEFLGGIFFCRRLKKSKRVQPDFCCKKWRGEQDG